jgi:hypothetical protein
MKKWFTFVMERIPVIPNLLIACGISFSAKQLVDGNVGGNLTLMGSVMVLFFLVELRIMDEYKDYEKDCVAHPERPLPRGLINLETYPRVIWIVMALYFAFTPVVWSYSKTAGILLLISQIWLILMYLEFFVGSWLEKRPFLYAITHQVVIIPLILGTYALVSGVGSFSEIPSSAYHFSLVILSLFFSYEVGRKLDPDADPILGTYLVHYGANKVFAFILALSLMGAYSAVELGVTLWLGVAYILSILSLLLFLKDNKKYKIAEAITTLNLIYGLWLFPLKELLS